MNWTQINCDYYGNPRYVCHYSDIADNYPDALKIAHKFHGRKFHNKQYGGGVVFSHYNLITLEKQLKGEL